MKKMQFFQAQRLINKHLKTIKGGEGTSVVIPSESQEEIDRSGGRPKTNG